MRTKHISIFAILAIAGATVSHGITAMAEDDNDIRAYEQVLEITQKQNEAAREAAKKQFEANREADKKAGENARESEKRRIETEREINKDSSIGDEADEDIEDDFDEDMDEDFDEDIEEDFDEDIEEDFDEDASEHRSAVADFVRELHKIASTTSVRAIGEEVRTVAKEQKALEDETVKAIDSVKGRSAVVTLILGADLKNLGELRNSIVTTENHINRLNDIKSRVSPDIRAELDKEISTLAAEKDRLANIVVENENKVSVLGWLMKLLQ